MRNIESPNHDNQATEHTKQTRAAWHTPRMSRMDMSDSNADQGGVNFDGQGFIS